MNASDIMFIQREDMTSIYEMADISDMPEIAYQHFMNYEEEVLYIVNNNKILGVLSIGDLERFYRENEGDLKINQRYTSLSMVDFAMAVDFFERTKTINELPIVVDDKILGIIRKNKDQKIRMRQRRTLKNAKKNNWHMNEITRFVNQTKAKVFLYTHSNKKIMEQLNEEDIEILNRRKNNISASEWRGLSDAEWEKFWQSEHADRIVQAMKTESKSCSPVIINGIAAFPDAAGDCYSFQDGYRITPNNPLNAERKILMFGPCVVIGAYCKDNQTIASCLQDYLNENNYTGWKVLNKGMCSLGNCYNQMFAEELSENDIVIIFCVECWMPQGVKNKLNIQTDLTEEFLKIPHLVDNLVDHTLHCNYIVNKKLAEKIFRDICKTGILDSPKQPGLPEKLQDYYIHWDIYEYFIDYFGQYGLHKESKDIQVGAIVMNCNPFTKGHRYLIEQALRMVDKLYIFVVEEDKSYFKFEDRFAMVKANVADLPNIHVIPSGKYVISKDTFAQYFEKEQVQVVESMDYDIYIFGEVVAAGLGIKYRFVGEEPFDRVTREYNETMKRLLPGFGVTVVEIPRISFGDDREIISASLVRESLQNNDISLLEKLCPKSTMQYLNTMETKV